MLVVLMEVRVPLGSEDCLVCNSKSSYSDFSVLAAPECSFPLRCSKVFSLCQ
jgi:hypothetical protein